MEVGEGLAATLFFRAEHGDDGAEACGEGGFGGVAEEGMAAEGKELLRLTEAFGFAGGEQDDAGAHAAASRARG